MNFTFENNIQVATEVVSRTSNEGTVIVMKMTDDDFFYKINGVAAEMWLKFSDKKSNLGSVAHEIATEYNISAEKVRTDAQVFLNKVLELKLIELV